MSLRPAARVIHARHHEDTTLPISLAPSASASGCCLSCSSFATISARRFARYVQACQNRPPTSAVLKHRIRLTLKFRSPHFLPIGGCSSQLISVVFEGLNSQQNESFPLLGYRYQAGTDAWAPQIAHALPGNTALDYVMISVRELEDGLRRWK